MLTGVAATGAVSLMPAALNAGGLLMATQDQVRPGAAADAGSQADNLFLFTDLAGAKGARLAAGDRTALRTVADWMNRFIIKPNQELGRSGPVCPFTPIAIDHDALWLALEHTEGRTVSEMIERVKVYNRLLLSNAPATGEFAGYKAIFVVYADLPAAKSKDFFDQLLKPIGLPFYENDGLVIGPFYEGNEGTAIYNANFRPFTSPMPSLLMRRAVVSDWKFFLNNPEWFAVWKKTHGEEGTEALAAELRRFPWNARDRS
jgi:hypothetical protein